MPQRTDLFANQSRRTLSPLPKHVLLVELDSSDVGFIKELANRAREHYATEAILRNWGREETSRFLVEKIPINKRAMSGDLGEILATEFVNAGSIGYQVPIMRLRWKDSRDMPMRGEDLIGFQFDREPIGFLKAEAKSRKRLSKSVIDQARSALKKNSGLPLSHTLAFIVERLYEANKDELANKIESYVIHKRPSRSQVAHLIFTFSQNDPSDLLLADICEVDPRTVHYSIGLRVGHHQNLIAAVFEGIIDG